MDKWQAIQSFWGNFGWNAYDENSVQTGENAPEYPYITYSAQVGSLNEPLALSASLWDRSDSWESVSKKADAIAEYIGYGYVVIKIDDGYMYITRGQPFAQRMVDEDDSIRRIYMNIQVEFLTAY